MYSLLVQIIIVAVHLPVQLEVWVGGSYSVS